MEPYAAANGQTIYHADCLAGLQELELESVSLVCTSPPYPGVQSLWGPLFAPERFDEAHAWLDRVWDACVRVLKPGGKLCINIANTGRSPYLDNAGRVGEWGRKCPDVEAKGQIIWDKQATSGETSFGTWRNPADPCMADDHEYICVFRKKGPRIAPTYAPVIDKQYFLMLRHSMWRMAAASATRAGHVTPFPYDLPARLITLYTFPGEKVLDPFLGSGTTLKAARDLARQGIGFEQDEGYCALALDNLRQYVLELPEPARVELEESSLIELG